ncbi:MAG: hypothetical protein ABIP06_07365 [Pyrinomonadaceae bacterium]
MSKWRNGRQTRGVLLMLKNYRENVTRAGENPAFDYPETFHGLVM